MDISESLSSATKIKEVLEAFPKHKRLPPIEEFYPVRRLLEARREILMKCIPFLNKVGKEIKMYVEEFGDKFFENIESRKNYIEGKLQESKAEKENQNKKIQLIQEIEKLEKSAPPSLEKITFDEDRSMDIIEYLHEHSYDINYELKDVLKDLVGLTYDKSCSNKAESYEKIISLL